MFATKTNDNSDTVSPPSTPYPHVNKNKNGTMVLVPPNQQCNVMPWAVHIHIVSRYSCCTYLHTKYIFIIFPHDWSNKEKEKKRNWNTSKVASTLGYLKRLLGPLGVKGRDWVCFRGKLQENQTGDASRFLGLYILPHCMYILVLNLPILSRAGIMEINGMMQLHGSGRMEEKHKHVWCACVW